MKKAVRKVIRAGSVNFTISPNMIFYFNMFYNII
jgi:hypothetical protein